MWYKYATLTGIQDFTKMPPEKETETFSNPVAPMLPPLHKQCKCKIIKRPGGKFEWITDLTACKACVNAKIRFNLEQDALSEETSSIYKPIIPPITEVPEISEISDTPEKEPIIPEGAEVVTPDVTIPDEVSEGEKNQKPEKPKPAPGIEEVILPDENEVNNRDEEINNVVQQIRKQRQRERNNKRY